MSPQNTHFDKLLKPSCIGIWLYRRNFGAIFAKKNCFGKSLGLFVEIPCLQIVDDGDVIKSLAVKETVTTTGELCNICFGLHI